MKKKILSILLAVLMLVSMIPVSVLTALAADPATADIVIDGMPVPEVGQTIDEYDTDAYGSWKDGSFTVNGGVWDAESLTFGDVSYDDRYYLDGSKNYIDYGDYETLEFAPGTYYMSLILGEGFDVNTTAIVNGVPAEVYDLGDGWVEVLVKLTVEAAPTITITGLTAPIAGQTMAEYTMVFYETLLDGSFTVNGAVFDDEDYNFGDVLYDGWDFYNSDGTSVGESAEIVPGTYYIEFYFGEDLGAGTTATANGTAGCVYYEEDWNGWVNVSFELNVTEEGTTIVPYVAPGNSIDAVEITLPAIAAGGDVPTASNVTLSDSNCTVTSVETGDPGYDVLYDRFEDGKVYGVCLWMKTEPGYAFDEDTVITLADANTENLRVEIDNCHVYPLGNASFACVELVARVGNPTPYWIGFRNNVGVVETYFGYGNGEYTLPECTFTAPSGKVFKAWHIAGNEYAAGATFNLTEDVWARAVWMDPPATYTVNFENGGNVTFNGAYTATRGVDYVCTLEPDDGYALAANQITVSVSGVNLGSEGTKWTYDASTGELTILGEYVTQYVEIYAKATVVPVYSLAATDVNMGTKEHGNTYDIIYVPINNNGNQILSFAQMKAELTAGDTDAFEAYVSAAGAVPAGESYAGNKLLVRSKADLAVGTYTATVTLSYDKDSDSTYETVLDTFEVTVTVAVPLTYTATLDNIDFGTITSGDALPAVKAITMTNTGTGIINLPRVEIISGGEYFELKTYSVPAQLGVGTGNSSSYGIQPKTGIGTGTFTATIQLTGTELAAPVTATVTYTVAPKPTYTVKLPTSEGYTIVPVSPSETVEHGEDYSFTIELLEGYRTTKAFKISVNGSELDPVSVNDGVYTYTIENITEGKTISVQGVEKIWFWLSCLGGPDGVGTKSDIKKYYGEPVTLPGAIFTRDGYKMIGWASTANATTITYELNASFTQNLESDLNLYPVWAKNSDWYWINCDPGEITTGTVQQIKKTNGTDATLPGAIFTRDGYKMIGWASTANATTAEYALEGKYTKDSDKDVTLYPVWERDGSWFFINCDPGTNGVGGVQQVKKTNGTDATLPGAIFTRDGYKMIGWASTANATTAEYALEGKYTKDSDKDVTLYPVWEEISHTHTYSNACDKTCNKCGETRTVGAHTYKTVVKPATTTANGYYYKECTKCGVDTAKTTIYKASKVSLSKTSYTYNGKVQTPSVTVKDSAGNTLKKDTDYTVSYASGRKNAGTYKVTVTMKGKYSGTKTLTFTIKPIDISKCKISLSKTSYTYNGKVQKPTVTVKNASGTKLSTSSYTVTYASGLKNAGTYKVTVKMKGNYSGTKTLTYKINPISVSKCKISLSKTSYTYNGKVQKPTVTVKTASGTKLTTSSYTVTYAKGLKNVGTYKVTIKMKGNYTGTKTLTYKINPVKTTVSKLTAGKKKLTVNITKKSTQVTGYQIQYSTSKKFTSAKTKTVSSYKTTKATLSSLKAKKTYYVRVRTYKTVNGTKYYSGWSTYKYKKTK